MAKLGIPKFKLETQKSVPEEATINLNPPPPPPPKYKEIVVYLVSANQTVDLTGDRGGTISTSSQLHQDQPPALHCC